MKRNRSEARFKKKKKKAKDIILGRKEGNLALKTIKSATELALKPSIVTVPFIYNSVSI